MIDYKDQRLGNYRLTRLLGTGGMASVYLAEHVHLGTQAAIKVLSPRLEGDNLERFLTEARLIAHLEHPHIVRVLEFGVEAEQPFLVMSYAPGGSLRQLHPAGTVLPLDTVVSSYVKQVAQALQYAHDEHVIHRDIKPENMLLGRHNEVLLSDFGLAVLSHSADAQQVLQAAGTMAYMAPEQIQGRPNSFSDQYALGVVVYEWLCGKRPFSGSLAEIASQHLSIPPPPLCEQVPTIPSAMEEVVLKALSKDPHERFATVHSFALALEEAYRETSSGQTQPELSSADDKGNHASPLLSLPAQLTPLIGREQEVAAARALLRRPETRMVTLTGTGGIGKTRLALQLATELVGDFADGLYFVSLAPITDPDLVLPTIAQALGLKETGGQSWLDLLQSFLQHKQCLLLLDNFEQVVTAAPQLVTLLQACPRLKILVTSRTLLRVSGEHHFPVAPLSVPDLKHLPEDEALVAYAAVALFLQRAQALKPDFQLTATNARAVAEICVHLDGLPLALELAAARITLLSPQGLLSRLSQRFALLTSGGQDAPARQQTLRNTIAWSYHLLDHSEQRLLRQLSVFAGGCAIEAVEAVCRNLDEEAEQVLDQVASLVDKNILRRVELEGEEPRFDMLETIREYGLEALETSGERESTRKAHAKCYLQLAEEATAQETAPNQLGAEQEQWFDRLEREHNNLRAALNSMLEGGERDLALRLSGALFKFWQVRGYAREGWTFLERALSASEGTVSEVRGKALVAAAWLGRLLGEKDRAQTRGEECLALYRTLGNQAGIAAATELMGGLAKQRNDFAAARTLFEESAALFKQLGDQKSAFWPLYNLAITLAEQGEYARARALLEELVATQREEGAKVTTARALFRLVWVIMSAQGDTETARPLLQEGLALFQEAGDKQGISVMLGLAADMALEQGHVDTAQELAEQSLALLQEVGYRIDIAAGYAGLGYIASIQGNLTAARALYEKSLAIAMELKEPGMIECAFVGLASVISSREASMRAASLLGAAQTLRNAMGVALMPVDRAWYERSEAALRAKLGEQAFAVAWGEGRAMTPEQALAAHEGVTLPGYMLGASPTSPVKPRTPYPNGLTAREVEVLRLVAWGLTDAQVAEQLVISPRTVNTHLKSIYGKIQVSSRSAATRYAIEHRLV